MLHAHYFNQYIISFYQMLLELYYLQYNGILNDNGKINKNLFKHLDYYINFPFILKSRAIYEKNQILIMNQ